MAWEALKAAWDKDEPLIQREIEKPDHPYPWKIVAGISLIALPIVPQSAFLSIPVTLWMCFAAGLASKPAQLKGKIHKSLLNEHAKTIRWILDQPEESIRKLNYAESLIADRRLRELKETLLERIDSLKAIPADGDLAERILARIRTYETGISEINGLSGNITEIIDDHLSIISKRADQDTLQKNVDRLTEAEKKHDNLVKAHALGVASKDEVKTASETIDSLRKEILCSSIRCTFPKIPGADYCSSHTCAVHDCHNANGSAAVNFGDHTQARFISSIVNIGSSLADTDEPKFNAKIADIFCGRCLESAKIRMSKASTQREAT